MSKLDETNMELAMLRKCMERLERRIRQLEELKKWLSYSDEEAVREASKIIAEEAARGDLRGEARNMDGFIQYRRKQTAELRPVVLGEVLTGVSISDEDRKAGSPKAGDMIARNPKNHDDQWLVAAQYFADNFEAITKP